MESNNGSIPAFTKSLNAYQVLIQSLEEASDFDNEEAVSCTNSQARLYCKRRYYNCCLLMPWSAEFSFIEQ